MLRAPDGDDADDTIALSCGTPPPSSQIQGALQLLINRYG